MSDHTLNPFARKPSPPPAQVRDAAGHVLAVGDEILLVTPSVLVRVASIMPVLAPGAPPNTMELVMVARVGLGIPRDSGVEHLYRTRTAEEIKDGLFTEAPDGGQTP